MKKETLENILVLSLFVGLILVSGYGIYMEGKYNECVKDSYNCSNNCIAYKSKEIPEQFEERSPYELFPLE